MTTPGLVTIGVPTFNRAPLLRGAVMAALEQDYRFIEVVIVDNGSTDATAAACDELRSLDRRVRVARQPRNVGPYENFQTALKLARGQFFMWLSDDDRINRTYVGSCVRKLCDEGHILVAGREIQSSVGASGNSFAMQLLSPNPTARVLDYLRLVSTNGTFFGVARTSDLSHRLPIPRLDWEWVAGLAADGTIAVSDDAEIYRPLEGLSADFRRMASALGWGWLAGHLPRAAISMWTFQFLATSPRLRPLGRPPRLSLAVKGGMIAWVRLGATGELTTPTRTLLQAVVPQPVYRLSRRMYRPLRRLQNAARRRVLTAPQKGNVSLCS